MTRHSPDDDPDVVYAYQVPNALRDALGKDADTASLFDKETITRCQLLIDEAKSEFFVAMRPELDQIKAIAGQAGTDGAQGRVQLSIHAKSIQSHARMLDFSLISTLCEYLLRLCDSHHLASFAYRAVLAGIIAALEAAQRLRIVDEGGETARDLLVGLDHLIQK